MAGEKKHKEKKKKDGGAAAAGAAKKLPEHLEKQRKYVICGHDKNYHTSTSTSASEYLVLGVDNAWNFAAFTEGLTVEVNSISEDGLTMEFDLIGVDPAVANALRRILIAEVPTVAIEHVFVVNNTSIVPDEMLAHRLGLVPLNVDPSLLEARGPEDAASEANTIVLRLRARCSRDAEGVAAGESVTSEQLEWLPAGSELPEETGCRFGAGGQASAFEGRPAPAPVQGGILLAKLRPGQEIELEAHGVKGAGREHAKWSPVATAWYRLAPEVALLRPVGVEEAAELAAAVPEVFEAGPDGQLSVKDVRSKEADRRLERVRRLLEDERWRGVVELRKRKDRFIFTIESTGALPADELFSQALALLADKAAALERRL